MRGDNWILKFIAIVVVTTWAISMVVSMVNKDYAPPVEIYPILLAIVGAVSGYQFSRKNEDGNGK